MKKWIISMVAFMLSLVLMAFIGFYAAIFLIGPHSDILPGWLHIPVAIFLLLIIIGTPSWFSYYTFHRNRKT